MRKLKRKIELSIAKISVDILLEEWLDALSMKISMIKLY